MKQWQGHRVEILWSFRRGNWSERETGLESDVEGPWA